VDNRKHLETSGPFAGLWVRTARALRTAGYKSPLKVRADIQRGALHPYISIFDYALQNGYIWVTAQHVHYPGFQRRLLATAGAAKVAPTERASA
jgi:hypothetical protein